MPRLAALERETLAADQRRFYDAVKAIRRRPISGPFIILMNSSPDLAARFAHLGHYFHSRGQADESILSLRVRAFVALIGSRALDVPYEWAAWVGWALEAGVPQDTVDAIRESRTPQNLTSEDALITDFCTQLISGNHRVSDATFRTALEHFGAQGLVELVMTLGYFTMIALPLNAFEIEMSDAQKGLRKPFVPLSVERRPGSDPAFERAVLPPISAASAPSPRVALPATHDDVAQEHQHFVDRIVRTRGCVPDVFKVLLHTPDVAERVANIGAFFLYESVVPAPARALVGLIAARELDCDYIWTAQTLGIDAAEIDPVLIAELKHGRLSNTASSAQQTLHQFCLQLMRGDHHVDDPTYSAMLDHFGVAATVQIAASLGYFAMIAFIANAFQVPPADRGESKPMY